MSASRGGGRGTGRDGTESCRGTPDTHRPGVPKPPRPRQARGARETPRGGEKRERRKIKQNKPNNEKHPENVPKRATQKPQTKAQTSHQHQQKKPPPPQPIEAKSDLPSVAGGMPLLSLLAGWALLSDPPSPPAAAPSVTWNDTQPRVTRGSSHSHPLPHALGSAPRSRARGGPPHSSPIPPPSHIRLSGKAPADPPVPSTVPAAPGHASPPQPLKRGEILLLQPYPRGLSIWFWSGFVAVVTLGFGWFGFCRWFGVCFFFFWFVLLFGGFFSFFPEGMYCCRARRGRPPSWGSSGTPASGGEPPALPRRGSGAGPEPSSAPTAH